MAISLYDATVDRFIQTLGAVEGFLARARNYCAENNIDLAEIAATRLWSDMQPFGFQLV
jgi:hypothetical protein